VSFRFFLRSKKKAETRAPDPSLTGDMDGKRALALVQTAHPLAAEADDASAPRSIEDPLLRSAQRGDSAAFRALFLRHSPGVRRYLGDLLRHDAAADDATQETFLRAFDSLRSLRDASRLSSWLFGIARNVFLEHCRAHKDRLWRLDAPGEESEPVDEAPTPDAALLLAEADRVLSEALSHVGEPRKSALLLRLDHGLAYEDIAEVMGWSVSKVKNEIHRGRLQLRTQLLRYLGGSP
jgi:RNA polymerase sigma-70 factor (ECF subfamily)